MCSNRSGFRVSFVYMLVLGIIFKILFSFFVFFLVAVSTFINLHRRKHRFTQYLRSRLWRGRFRHQRGVPGWSPLGFGPPEAEYPPQGLHERDPLALVVVIVAEHSGGEVVGVVRSHEHPQVGLGEAVLVILFDRVVRVHDDGDEERQDDVDVQAGEGV